MCGIAGTVSDYWPQSQFERLFDAIAHRGPDAKGTLAAGSVRIGMHRLHLRGPASELPVNEGGGVVAFNGQVYGRRRSDGTIDTQESSSLEQEAAAVRDGVADGMYAAAFLSRDGSRLQLTRDPFFMKPMFYAQSDHGLAFCSELSALPRVLDRFELRHAGLAELFSYGWYLDDQTWLNGVSMLQRHDLLVRGSHISKQDPRPLQPAAHGPSSPRELRVMLRESVRRCLDNVDTVGLALSGGLDSSILAWELNELGMESVVTVSLEVPEHDDGIARLECLGLPPGGAWTKWKHYSLRGQPDEAFLSTFHKSTLRFGQPTTMSSLPLTWQLAEAFAGAGVRVVLTGEGADELFCGYGSYAKVASLHAPLAYYGSSRRRELVESLFGESVAASARKDLEERYGGVEDLRLIENELRLARLLLRTDVCFMAHSIEARMPFLHNGIPELALGMAWNELCAHGGKSALRQAWSRDLGARAAARKTRFKPSDAALRRCLTRPSVAQRIQARLSEVFDGPRLKRVLTKLDTDAGFDPDVSSLLLSLCFLLERNEATVV